MVSKCCWREPAKNSRETELKNREKEQAQKLPEKSTLRSSNGSTVMLSFEDDCDKKLEITDLTKNGQIVPNSTAPGSHN